MTVTELEEKECRALLQRASMGRLGCALDNQPYVIPIYLAYDNDSIYVFSTFGKKIEWMRVNPKVCVQFEEVGSDTEWASVIVNGLYEELPEPQFRDEVKQARKLLEKRHHWWLNALAERRLQLPDSEIAPLFFRIRVNSLSGLRTQAD
ncbi:MAG TPA: pyridoxamine 5'-phosphate oxidase family protein [Terriglobales bacterium]|jgi:hypothetical protein